MSHTGIQYVPQNTKNIFEFLLAGDKQAIQITKRVQNKVRNKIIFLLV